METFFVILLIIIIALAVSSKKNKNKAQQHQFAKRTNVKVKPTQNEMTAAHFYYAESWRHYLTTHHGKYELWLPDFFEIAALALGKLSSNEQDDLKIAVNDKGGEFLLYTLTLRLLRNCLYDSENVCKAYRTVIDNFQKQQKDSQRDNCKSSPSIITNNQYLILDNTTDHQNFQSILDPPIVHDVSNKKKENDDIIDITDQKGENLADREDNLQSVVNSSLQVYRDIDNVAESDDSPLFDTKQKTPGRDSIYSNNTLKFESTNRSDDYLLGKRYKEKMGLSEAQATLVNKLPGIGNVFLQVEGCCLQAIKLFLICIEKLKATLAIKGSDLNIEIKNLSDNARKINKKTRDGQWLFNDYYGDNHVNDYFTKQVYHTIFKRAENLIRDKWDHNRKVSADFIQYFKGLSEIFENRIGTDVNIILESLRSSISDPDRVTEIELNRLSIRRWMLKFDTLKNELNNENIANFTEQVHKLFDENEQNPSAGNIYYEACKVAYPFDNREAIRLYLYYVNADLRSDKLYVKKLAKNIRKVLFNDDRQEQIFNDIIEQLKKDRAVASAIKKVDAIYLPVRKKIELNLEAIKTVQQQDKNTVELLNNYLQDEEELVDNPAIVNSTPTEKPPIETEAFEVEPNSANPFIDEIDLALHHREIIVEFTRSEFSLTQEQISNYCAAKGLRSGPTINDINERCYELLDDNLIEERDDEYLDMNEDYYKMIIKA